MADPCDSCGAKAVGVIDSRLSAYGRWRTRHCGACGERWQTLEVRLGGRRALGAAVRDALRSVSEAAEALRDLSEKLPADDDTPEAFSRRKKGIVPLIGDSP